MKLDRNVNRGGRGKYALVNMRKLIPAIEAIEACANGNVDVLLKSEVGADNVDDVAAFERLVERGIITLGNETPGDQFFVMKYKDAFTGPALQAYADAIKSVLRYRGEPKPPDGLSEYWFEVQREADAARKLGTRIPD